MKILTVLTVNYILTVNHRLTVNHSEPYYEHLIKFLNAICIRNVRKYCFKNSKLFKKCLKLYNF